MGEEKEYIIEMDQEWLTLILEAKNMGFKKEEIRDFFRTKELKELISGRLLEEKCFFKEQKVLNRNTSLF